MKGPDFVRDELRRVAAMCGEGNPSPDAVVAALRAVITNLEPAEEGPAPPDQDVVSKMMEKASWASPVFEGQPNLQLFDMDSIGCLRPGSQDEKTSVLAKMYANCPERVMPIVVRDNGGVHSVVDGEKRINAARQAGHKKIWGIAVSY